MPVLGMAHNLGPTWRNTGVCVGVDKNTSDWIQSSSFSLQKPMPFTQILGRGGTGIEHKALHMPDKCLLQTQNFPFQNSFYLFSVCTHTHTTCQQKCGSQGTTCRSQFTLSTTWVPGLECRLRAGMLSHLAGTLPLPPSLNVSLGSPG